MIALICEYNKSIQLDTLKGELYNKWIYISIKYFFKSLLIIMPEAH